MTKARKRRAVLEDAGMYRMNRQMRIEDFVFPYAKIEHFPFMLSTRQPIFSAP